MDRRIGGRGRASLGSIWIHLDALRFTWTHLDTLGLTWTHLDSLGLTWIHLDSLQLTRSHQDSLEPQKTRTKYPPDGKGKRERLGGAAQCSPIPTSLPDRGYARTNETKRFPGCAPPNLRFLGLLGMLMQHEVRAPVDVCSHE